MKKAYVGIFIFVVLAVIGIGISLSQRLGVESGKEKTATVYGAVGGGKENFLQDKDVQAILADRYQITLKNTDWSNSKLIKDALTFQENGREQVYDFVFFSDERFYEYYKTSPADDEAPRHPVLKSAVALNTPIVIYSWGEICDAFIKQSIVKEKNGVYYITDMDKLIKYIVDGTKWSDIGVNDVYGKINISSTDPVTSSPGATYYGLLASVMNGGFVDMDSISRVMPSLKEFYRLSGFMNNTPADLFDLYLRMGRGAYPLVVDYEKSMIDFAKRHPEDFEVVKDKIRILYPEPTIWNSHCIMSFSENGSLYLDALQDKEIQDIAWQRYGFRTGLTGGQYDVKSVAVEGIPQEIVSITRSLRKNVYDEIVAGLR